MTQTSMITQASSPQQSNIASGRIPLLLLGDEKQMVQAPPKLDDIVKQWIISDPYWSQHCIETTIDQIFDHPDIWQANDPLTAPTIEQIRETAKELLFPPHQIDRKLYIIWQFERASIPAQNAFLKNLEEPPAYADIILVSHQKQTILETILSRVNQVYVSVAPAMTTAAGGAESGGRNGGGRDGDGDGAATAISYPPLHTMDFWLKTPIATIITSLETFDRAELLIALSYWIKKTLADQSYPTASHLLLLTALQDAYTDLSLNANQSLTLERIFMKLQHDLQQQK